MSATSLAATRCFGKSGTTEPIAYAQGALIATWIAATGDIHAGSTIAPCPRSVELDDGGAYEASALQSQLYDWWQDAWQKVGGLIGRDRWHLVLNGDLFDGDHHNTPQILSRHPGVQFRVLMDLMRSGPMPLNPSWVHVVRGTEAHVGKSGSNEESFARVIAAGDNDANGFPAQPVIGDDATGQTSTFWRRFRCEGHLIDCRHHGRMGQRAHTRGSYARLYAHDIWEEHVSAGDKAPALCIRSHHHTFEDSGQHRYMPRVVTLPAWQCLTAFGHRIAIENVSDVGLVLFRLEPGRIDVYPLLYKPGRPKVVEL